jgi:hypothetical protein
MRRKMTEIFAFYVKNCFYYFRFPERLRPKSSACLVAARDLLRSGKFKGNRATRLRENAIRMRSVSSRFATI